jgi:siroheme synthase
MSNLGLVGALATVEGNQNALTLRGAAYQSYLNAGGRPSDFNKFAAAFNKDINPFVMQIRALPAAQQQQMLSSMPPKEKAAIMADAAKVDKLINAIGWQP